MNLEDTSLVQESVGDNFTNKCERIKACIDSYLEKNSRLSLQCVEDKTGVPGSTLRRIVSLKGNPQPEAVIKIFQNLGYESDLYNYLKDFHPDIAKLMVIKNNHNINTYSLNMNESEKDYFINEDYYLLINLAYTRAGTSEEEIFYELGRKGVEKLYELDKKGIIENDGKGRYFGKHKEFKLSAAHAPDVKKRIEMSLKYYRIEEAGNCNNWMSFQTESINNEGLKALKTLQQKHFSERYEQIFNNPIYNGNLKVYSATVSSTFITYTDLGVLQ